MVDITDEHRPVPVGSFQVEGIEGKPHPVMTACHQPCEKVTGSEIPFAWFAARPAHHRCRQSARAARGRPFVPDVPQGTDRVSSNDLTVDERGLIYLIDRRRGLTIVERT